ncbi:MAG: FHA domain-containing protein [Pyrinomonas methylaliphatogenes]|nr:FHA domain-containing protein [Pyrinomonas methylaliphatogenes]
MDENERKEARRDETLVERLLHRALESLGAALDRRLGLEPNTSTALTTSRLIERMRRLIDERAVEDAHRGRLAPHVMKLKIEWGTHSSAPDDLIEELKKEILTAAIDHINDQRLRTFAPVRVEVVADIFTTGITVDPSFGEFEEEARRLREGGVETPAESTEEIVLVVEIRSPEGQQQTSLRMVPGGQRIDIGRAADNDLCLRHPSVSKIHATMAMTREGSLLLSDAGSTNGTYINGRRIAYGEARAFREGDVINFGEVEVRFRRLAHRADAASSEEDR